MAIIYVLAYLGFCIVIGLAGRNLALGFAGLFLVSVFLTPATGLVLLVLLLAHRAAAR